jgi:hypothetical protein
MVGRVSGWKRRVVFGLGLLFAVAWFLPTLVAHSPLLGWLVSKAGKDLKGTVKVGGASLGWFSPIILRDVVVRDAAGEPLMSIPKIESDKSLLNVLIAPNNPGRFRCEKAALEVVFNKDATNVEAALANIWINKAEAGKNPEGAPTKAWSPLALALDFEAAQVTIHDTTSRRQWVLDPVVIHLGLNQQGAPPLQIQVQAALAGGSPATLQTELTLDPTENGVIKLKGKVDNFPVALAVPVLRRLQMECVLEGHVRGQWDLTLGKNKASCAGELLVEDCVAGGPLFGEDTIRMAQIKMPWKLALEGNRLRVDLAEIVCDVGQVSIKGNIPAPTALLTHQNDPDLNLALDLDLARLAEKFPKSLRLRPDTKLIAGRLTANCKRVAGPGDTVDWQGDLHSTELRGLRAGQIVSWPEPAALTFHIRQAKNELPTIEQLRCESSFLKLDADDKGDQLTVMASMDLQKLVLPLNQFFDMSQVYLEGKAGGQITILHKQPGYFQMGGGGFLQAFHLDFGKNQTWHEDSFKFTLQADGKILPAGGQCIESGYVRLESGADILDAQVVAPITNLTQGPWGNLQVKLDGDLARWQARLRPWTNALDAWQFRGATQAHATIRLTANGLEASGLSMTSRDFQCIGPGVTIREALLEVQAASARADIQKSNLALQNVLVRCPTLMLQAPNIQARAQGGWVEMSPTEAILNGGRLRLDAKLRLEPPALYVAKGSMLDHAQITPALCSGALGYVLPALAGATAVQGLTSVSLEGGHLDFTDMAKSELKGVFTLHSAEIGAGPMVHEFGGLLRVPGSADISRESQVPFQVAQGRVHHQNLALAFPDFTVRTSGSVGMDGTIELVAEMPVPPKWLINNPLANSLSKQSIRLPIRGTIDHPRLDAQALQAASSRFLRDMATDAVRQGLEGNLMKLLGR